MIQSETAQIGMVKGELCETCKFFMVNHMDKCKGWCRFFPPSVYVVPARSFQGDHGMRHDPAHDDSDFPRVGAGDWCGQWKETM